MIDNKKPLGEWTLAEVKEYCQGRTCLHCLFGIPEKDSTNCLFKRSNPIGWNLSEPPRWTEQEVEDAKALLRLLPGFITIERLTTKHFDTEILVIEDAKIPNSNRLYLPTFLFPSLEMNKEVELKEIAEYKQEG